MDSFYQMAKRAGMVIMLGLLFFVLEGCQKPFVEVVVDVDGCCKAGGDCRSGGVEGCSVTDVPNPGGFTVPSTGVQCSSGTYCTSEGSPCTRSTKCRTVANGTGECSCNCLP